MIKRTDKATTARRVVGVAVAAAALGGFASSASAGEAYGQSDDNDTDIHSVFLRTSLPICSDPSTGAWTIPFTVEHNADEPAVVTGDVSAAIAAFDTAQKAFTKVLPYSTASYAVTITVNWESDPGDLDTYDPVTLSLSESNPCGPPPTTTTTTTVAPSTTQATTTTTTTLVVPPPPPPPPVPVPTDPPVTSAAATTSLVPTTAPTTTAVASTRVLPQTGSSETGMMLAIGSVLLTLGVGLRRRFVPASVRR